MEKIVKINGMRCEKCEKKVYDTLSPFTKSLTVSHSDNKAVLNDTTLDDNKIKELVEDLGFEVEEIINK